MDTYNYRVYNTTNNQYTIILCVMTNKFEKHPLTVPPNVPFFQFIHVFKLLEHVSDLKQS